MPKRICLVDDDPGVRDSVRDLLESAGLAVAVHESAESFLASYRPGDFDLVLCDVHLAGMTGSALLENLRAAGDTVPALLFTAYPTELLRRKAREYGAGELIEKPFDPEALIDRVIAAAGA